MSYDDTAQRLGTGETALNQRWKPNPRRFAPLSGRVHTTASTTTIDVAERLRELDCDPIAGMARLAQDGDQPAALRGRMLAELATYIAPRRKAVELSGPSGEPIKVDLSRLSRDERGMLAELLVKVGVGE